MDVSQIIEKGEEKAEFIVKNSNSHLCNAISYMKDKERVKAFNAMYAIMRIVDDIVDDKKIGGKDATKEEIIFEIKKWKKFVESAYEKIPIVSPISLSFCKAIEKFPIPKIVWDNFFDSMEKDIENPDFKDFDEFEKYSIGAACAPTKIYLFLTLSKEENGTYTLNDFDYETAGYNLGLWAYMVHILRDAKEDTENNLFYLPDKELKKFNLKKESLIEFLKKEKSNEDFSEFIKYYIEKADSFYQRSIMKLEDYSKGVEISQKFTLFIVIRIYKIIEKNIIEMKEDLFSAKKQRLKPDYPVIISALKNEIGF